MSKLLSLVTLLTACALPLACTAEVEVEVAPGAGTSTEVASAQRYTVNCGCRVDSVGHCGNYIEVGGEYLELAGDLGLGRMEWCGEPGALEADVAGEVVEGQFVATSLSVVE